MQAWEMGVKTTHPGHFFKRREPYLNQMKTLEITRNVGF